MKYPIKKEFFPYTHFSAPLSPAFLKLAAMGMKKTPGFVYKDPALLVESRLIPGYQGGMIEILILTPKNLPAHAPCLLDIHGGGFVLEGGPSHYRMAMAYAKQAQCKVIYVRYRLSPAYPFPVPQEDCYAALCWIYDHADELGIGKDRIGIAGDSAGGMLAVAACLMARDRGYAVKPLFQLLIYPFLDGRNGSESWPGSESFNRFTDTPMWNSTLSRKVGQFTTPEPDATPLAYRSPVEADSLANLPPAYVEVAEFDCLHDDGVLYAQLLQQNDIAVQLHEVKGAMHGFDTKTSAPTSQKMVAQRSEYMKNLFSSI
ncbi:MAG: alpha/beta hydrolase [Clostridia bacterium]|nr:alpha/beta hydrolase [Clostridia bacterium]